MNYLHNYINFDTIEEGEKKLEQATALYNSMGGTWYKSAVYDDCCEIRRKLDDMKAKQHIDSLKQ